ncbi:hypothetical protein [Streptomyces hydrogenans]|uniref:Uncharacterized protein n=1 Tax=Streptomyces hydrogenans TaxID=1873719 RepID=A0ABQ3PP91_9ACTN|nr:hypothetical protein [Streptomyces hydrogenans]GHG04834.1 hypothetical protein GCM10018784_16420 [Streptomyces hydrogenans]GHI26807.1 hypothetical protein Shyd_81780 [Streptomyces hydrogenans]
MPPSTARAAPRGGHAAEGGGLEKRMRGDVFGMRTDAFGVVRLVDIAGQPS